MNKNLDFPLYQAPMVWGKDVRTARTRLGITQKEMAKHLGISVQSIRLWEQNDAMLVSNPSRARDIHDMLMWGRD